MQLYYTKIKSKAALRVHPWKPKPHHDGISLRRPTSRRSTVRFIDFLGRWWKSKTHRCHRQKLFINSSDSGPDVFITSRCVERRTSKLNWKFDESSAINGHVPRWNFIMPEQTVNVSFNWKRRFVILRRKLGVFLGKLLSARVASHNWNFLHISSPLVHEAYARGFLGVRLQ